MCKDFILQGCVTNKCRKYLSHSTVLLNLKKVKEMFYKESIPKVQFIYHDLLRLYI